MTVIKPPIQKRDRLPVRGRLTASAFSENGAAKPAREAGNNHRKNAVKQSLTGGKVIDFKFQSDLADRQGGDFCGDDFAATHKIDFSPLNPLGHIGREMDRGPEQLAADHGHFTGGVAIQPGALLVADDRGAEFLDLFLGNIPADRA